MEVAVEVEDDLFFADLSKQISLLIMDDDDDSVVRYPSVSVQVFYPLIIYMLFIFSTLKHFLSFLKEKKKRCSVQKISGLHWCELPSSTMSICSRTKVQKRKQQRYWSLYPKVIATAKKEA